MPIIKLNLIMILAALLVGMNSHAGAPLADFYVAPDGSDQWSGRLAVPNAERTDGPFASLDRARMAVQKLKQREAKDTVVLIRGGTYRLSKTVVFGLEDSSPGGTTTTYAAYPGEKPVFSSGVPIKGWKKVSGELPGLPKAALGRVWVADVSDRFYALFDDKGMLPRARSAGFIPREGGSRTSLKFASGQLKHWDNLEDVEIVIRPHHAWVLNILPVSSVDEARQVATVSVPASYAMNELHFLKGTLSCWVENVLEALDEPGEWVLNTKEGKLYLWARGGGVPKGVVAPGLKEYIRVEGKVDKMGPKDIPVRNLRFEGLTFMHGERDTLMKDDKGLQHDWEMHDKGNALIRFRGAENCAVERCHFLHSAGGAIRVDLHGQKIRIADNHIEHIGGTGILLCGYGPGTKDVNHHNLVYNNHIHHVGQIYAHSPGIFVWQSGDNRVANNLVHHTPYSGIIVSGVVTQFFGKRRGREMALTIRWDEIEGRPGTRTHEQVQDYLHSDDNLIEYNEIHHAMELLGDGNGIYIRGAGAGNVIRRNYIHHLLAPIVMQSAIRTDGGQRDTLIAENLIYKCVSHGIHLKLNNRAENNFIVGLIEGVHKGRQVPVSYMRLREGPLRGGAIKRNIFYHMGDRAKFYDQGNNPRLKAAWAKEADTDFNIFYCAGDPEVGKQMLSESQQDGVDGHSLAVDPLFVNPEKGDFRFQTDSPALKLGIVPFDMSKVGLRKTESTSADAED